jgi:hypothetical protein
MVNHELLLRNEYLAAENRILRARLPDKLRLVDSERATLAEIGKRLGRKALEQIACIAKPDTILGWYRKLVAQKFDGSKFRTYPGRPRIARNIEGLIIRIARENPNWGYDRILFGEGSLRRALKEYLEHYHSERNHRGKENLLLFPRAPSPPNTNVPIRRTQRLGGLLNFYSRAA